MSHDLTDDDFAALAAGMFRMLDAEEDAKWALIGVIPQFTSLCGSEVGPAGKM